MQVIITGDKSRYQFFRDTVSMKVSGNRNSFFTERMGENDVYLTSDKDKVKDNTYYSEKVPLNTMVYFPKEYGNSEILYGTDDRIIFFDEFPYGTDEDVSNLNQIAQAGKFGQLEVVLFQNERTALSSDISTEMTAMENAEIRYKGMGINVCRYSTKDKADFFVWTVRSLPPAGAEFLSAIKKVRNYLSTFDSCYDLEYELILHPTIENPEILDSHFKFESKLKGRNVWNLYYERACNYYWKNNYEIDRFIIGVYERGIVNTELCAWDLSADINNLKKSIRNLFSRQFECFEILIYTGKKEGYAQFLNENLKEVLDFKRKIIVFFAEELKQFLKERILRDIKRMESVLHDYAD